MKKLLVGTVAVAALAMALPATAQAQHNWTGFYLGANVGSAWTTHSSVDVTALPDEATFVNLKNRTFDLDGSDFIGGVHGGYNWQWKQLVLGGEIDISGNAAKGDTTVTPIIQFNGTPFPGPGYTQASQQTSVLGTLRPRIGYTPLNGLLLYGTAGLAWGIVNYRANTNFVPVGTEEYHVSFQNTQIGWTAGGGVEYAIASNWSVRAEYLYVNLGSASATADPSIPFPPGSPPYQVRYNFETRDNVARVGLSFKF